MPLSPRTQLTASTMLLLPHPFGPTMQVTPSSNRKVVLLRNDLKPSRLERGQLHVIEAIALAILFSTFSRPRISMTSKIPGVTSLPERATLIGCTISTSFLSECLRDCLDEGALVLFFERSRREKSLRKRSRIGLAARVRVLPSGLRLVFDPFAPEELGHPGHLLEGSCPLFEKHDDLEEPGLVARRVPHLLDEGDEAPRDLGGRDGLDVVAVEPEQLVHVEDGG